MKPQKRLISLATATILFAATLISCENQEQARRLKQLDSLGIHLNHVQEILAQVDSNMLAERSDEISKISSWVMENTTDTLDRAPGIAFGDYMRCKKFLGKAADRYRQTKKEFRFSEVQLQHLKNDVKNDALTDEEYRQYFASESQAIGKLVEATEELEGKYTSVMSQYDRVKPVVTSIVDSIKSIIYAPEPVGKK